jgi:hypothetical protein
MFTRQDPDVLEGRILPINSGCTAVRSPLVRTCIRVPFFGAAAGEGAPGVTPGAAESGWQPRTLGPPAGAKATPTPSLGPKQGFEHRSNARAPFFGGGPVLRPPREEPGNAWPGLRCYVCHSAYASPGIKAAAKAAAGAAAGGREAGGHRCVLFSCFCSSTTRPSCSALSARPACPTPGLTATYATAHA